MAPNPKTDESRRMAEKLGSLLIATRHDYPTGDIGEMLAAIESGYVAFAPPKADA